MTEIISFILDYVKIFFIDEENYFVSSIFFFLFLTLYNVIGLPGHVFLMLVSGYFFGTYFGFLLCLTSIVLGSFIFYLFGKNLCIKFFPGFLNKYSNKINHYVKKNTLEYLVIFRLFPGTPLFLQNLILCFLNINKKVFFLSTVIGFAPGVFVTVYFGDQINNFKNINSIKVSDVFSLEFYLSIFIVIIVLFIKIFYSKKYQ